VLAEWSGPKMNNTRKEKILEFIAGAVSLAIALALCAAIFVGMTDAQEPVLSPTEAVEYFDTMAAPLVYHTQIDSDIHGWISPGTISSPLDEVTFRAALRKAYPPFAPIAASDFEAFFLAQETSGPDAVNWMGLHDAIYNFTYPDRRCFTVTYAGQRDIYLVGVYQSRIIGVRFTAVP
jgi:hypothetical protein